MQGVVDIVRTQATCPIDLQRKTKISEEVEAVKRVKETLAKRIIGQ
jgi:hypothetical protein